MPSQPSGRRAFGIFQEPLMFRWTLWAWPRRPKCHLLKFEQVDFDVGIPC